MIYFQYFIIFAVGIVAGGLTLKLLVDAARNIIERDDIIYRERTQFTIIFGAIIDISNTDYIRNIKKFALSSSTNQKKIISVVDKDLNIAISGFTYRDDASKDIFVVYIGDGIYKFISKDNSRLTTNIASVIDLSKVVDYQEQWQEKIAAFCKVIDIEDNLNFGWHVS